MATAWQRYNHSEKGKAHRKLYYQTNRKKLDRYAASYRNTLKIIALQIYSNGTMICNNCGFDDIDCLMLDHIKNDGAQHRKHSRNTWLWLQKNNYPYGFQILCANCNWKKYLEYHDFKKGE